MSRRLVLWRKHEAGYVMYFVEGAESLLYIMEFIPQGFLIFFEDLLALILCKHHTEGLRIPSSRFQ